MRPVPTLPDVPGVRFRPVPGFRNYLVSDDNKVWIARRLQWQEMKPHTGKSGKPTVWLMNDGNPGGEDRIVTDLVQQIFGGE